ncbi:putative sodium-coupled neutral amino acid transporter 10 [Trichogramma pretiosum]|uniref:putative sodium-coupled neutral amino acid transporter 10 n=1 Tax=Trichogramma pretiosum TaxID=7493 RepID=UPI0006C99F95|nr:putative sodium-coupled neutral amino acid transporter 10 [Trichogramma pretiosum]
MISHVTTLANSIIGVSVLAMPFCFKQCGIILATLMLLLSSIFSRLACHFLIKSAVMSRRRNFEFLAFHAFGLMGKCIVELCIIGFLFGTCIAYFVVAGDLGPQIVGGVIDKRPEDIRTSFLITTGIFIVLPLGLLRNIDSLASVSTASIAFYIIFVLKVVGESTHHIIAGDWFDKVNFWRPAGLLQCIPIFSLALFCQTQLFEIYESMSNPTLEKMNQVVKGALNICTGVYLCVGLFGYIAFCAQPFTGNILMSFEPSLTSEIIKIGFVLSVAFSFPLVIFPCRASLNSLLFKQGYTYDVAASYISETRFRCLTSLIVLVALSVGILIPNIEFVLGIVGSTIGVIICLIFPAMFFISISIKNTNERLLAQVMVFIGVWMMILGTYANLYAMEQSSNLKSTTDKLPRQINDLPKIIDHDSFIKTDEIVKQINDYKKIIPKASRSKPIVPNIPENDKNARKEPPVPVERLPKPDKKIEVMKLKSDSINIVAQPAVNIINDKIDKNIVKETEEAYKSLKKTKSVDTPLKNNVNEEPIKKSDAKNDIIAVDAIKKEELELAADKDIIITDGAEKREQLEKTLQKHILEQREMMQEQKKILKDIEHVKKDLQIVEKENSILEKKNAVEVEAQKLKTDEKTETKLVDENLKKDAELEKNLTARDKNIIKPNGVINQNVKPSEIAEPKNNEKVLKQPVNVIQIDNLNPTNKSGSQIIKALTKKSFQLNNESSVIRNNGKNDSSNNDNNVNIKPLTNEIPVIIPKVSNDSKLIVENINEAGMKRDLLSKHQREKRMVEFAENIKSASQTNQEKNVTDESKLVDLESCRKQEKLQRKDTQNEKTEGILVNLPKDNEVVDDLIKTSSHLSEQNVMDKNLVKKDLNVDSKFINFNDKNNE